MTGKEAFEAWAPATSLWSPWVKPVLFASANEDLQATMTRVEEAAWAPGPGEGAAFVVDMPGGQSITLGLALALQGYRPVPLFNGVFHPMGVVPVQPLVASLLDGAVNLQSLNLPDDAPPAFLLDSQRLTGDRLLSPGKFDNRWLVLPQDCPSANCLLSQQIERIILLQPGQDPVRDDLAHVLLRWQQAGIRIERQNHPPSQPPQLIRVKRPWGFKWFWYRFFVMLGLRRNSAGGFGSIIPEVEESTG